MTYREGRRSLDVVPIFLGEGVYLLLALTLLTLTQALVLPATKKKPSERA